MTVTHSKVIKVVGPVAQLLVGAALHAGVGDVLQRGVGQPTETQSRPSPLVPPEEPAGTSPDPRRRLDGAFKEPDP